MSSSTKKVPFCDTEIGIAARATLLRLVADDAYNTPSGYHIDQALYPNDSFPFVEKHMAYLASHSTVNPTYYLSNLRLMTRRKD